MRITHRAFAKLCLAVLTVMFTMHKAHAACANFTVAFKSTNAGATASVSLVAGCSAWCGAGYPIINHINTGATASCFCYASSCSCDAANGCVGGGAAWQSAYPSGAVATCVRTTCCDSSCKDTTWSVCATGYQTMKTASCSGGGCTMSSVYQCDIGYYGAPTTCAANCNRCPQYPSSNPAVYGTTSTANTSNAQGCWISAGTSITLSSPADTFKINTQCPYI